MKIKEVIEIYNKLSELDNLTGVKFAYAININKNAFKIEVENIAIASKPSPAYLQFEKEEGELIKSHATKNDNGEVIQVKLDNGQYGFNLEPLLIEQFKVKREKLNKTHSAAIQIHIKNQKEILELLDSEYSGQTKMIDFNDIPENISVKQMNIIEQLITK